MSYSTSNLFNYISSLNPLAISVLLCSCIACGGTSHSSLPCDRLAFHGLPTGMKLLYNDIKTMPQPFLHRANFNPLKAWKLLERRPHAHGTWT